MGLESILSLFQLGKYNFSVPICPLLQVCNLSNIAIGSLTGLVDAPRVQRDLELAWNWRVIFHIFIFQVAFSFFSQAIYLPPRPPSPAPPPPARPRKVERHSPCSA